MSLKAKLEAIIYAAETPITLDHMVQLVKDSAANENASANDRGIRAQVRDVIEGLIADYSSADHGVEIRQIAGGYRMSTKPEQHDVVRAFAKSLKPPIRLSLPALETLGVIATLLDRKLITTAGRKAVIGRPILYRTSKEFLLRFGLKDVSELPSMEEFEKLVAESFEGDLPLEASARTDATGAVDAKAESGQPENETPPRESQEREESASEVEAPAGNSQE